MTQFNVGDLFIVDGKASMIISVKFKNNEILYETSDYTYFKGSEAEEYKKFTGKFATLKVNDNNVTKLKVA